MSATSIPPTGTINTEHKPGEIPAAGYTHQHPQHQKESIAEKVEELERDLKETTDQAVADGKQDVTEATATYLEKALHLADTGITAAQTYVGAGKERLQSPAHQTEHPPTGLAASLAATAASALTAAGTYLGLAQEKIHEQQQHPSTHHPHDQHTAVTAPTKPMGQALSDNVTAAQAAVQPHVDAAYATAKPHVDAAQATVQPHIDSAVAAAQPHIDSVMATAQPHIDNAIATAQPHIDSAKAAAQPHVDAASATVASTIDSAKQAWNSDKPLTQQAQEAAQPHLDAAKEAYNSDKPLMQQAQEATQPHVDAAKSYLQSNTNTNTVESNLILEGTGTTHSSVEASKPTEEYPLAAAPIPAQAAKDSQQAAAESLAYSKGADIPKVEDSQQAAAEGAGYAKGI